ncbi:MAG: hypothetical protein WDW38_009664 [Sanguina aurantia]
MFQASRQAALLLQQQQQHCQPQHCYQCQQHILPLATKHLCLLGWPLSLQLLFQLLLQPLVQPQVLVHAQLLVLPPPDGNPLSGTSTTSSTGDASLGQTRAAAAHRTSSTAATPLPASEAARVDIASAPAVEAVVQTPVYGHFGQGAWLAYHALARQATILTKWKPPAGHAESGAVQRHVLVVGTAIQRNGTLHSDLQWVVQANPGSEQPDIYDTRSGRYLSDCVPGWYLPMVGSDLREHTNPCRAPPRHVLIEVSVVAVLFVVACCPLALLSMGFFTSETRPDGSECRGSAVCRRVLDTRAAAAGLRFPSERRPDGSEAQTSVRCCRRAVSRTRGVGSQRVTRSLSSGQAMDWEREAWCRLHAKWSTYKATGALPDDLSQLFKSEVLTLNHKQHSNTRIQIFAWDPKSEADSARRYESGFKMFLDSDRAITSVPGPLHASKTTEYLKVMERQGQQQDGPYRAFLSMADMESEQQAVAHGLPSLKAFRGTPSNEKIVKRWLASRHVLVHVMFQRHLMRPLMNDAKNGLQ